MAQLVTWMTDAAMNSGYVQPSASQVTEALGFSCRMMEAASVLTWAVFNGDKGALGTLAPPDEHIG